jgi:hypothetical protein
LAEAKTEAESKGAVMQAAAPPSNGKVVAMPLPAPPPPTSGGRLGLADLKRAAQERRARQEAGIPQCFYDPSGPLNCFEPW